MTQQQQEAGAKPRPYKIIGVGEARRRCIIQIPSSAARGTGSDGFGFATADSEL